MNREQWGTSTAFLALALGAAAVAFERPWPDDPVAFSAFLAANRGAILAQSMLFMFSAAANLWFLGSVRAFLAAAEGGAARVSGVAFGAGTLWAGFNVFGQAPQILLALPSQTGMQPGLARVMADLVFVLLNIANIPLGVMFAAIAVVSMRTRVFPTWLAWLAALCGVAAFTLSFGVVAATGPLSPQGWLTLALYPAPALWIIPAAIVMMRRIGRTAAAPDADAAVRA